MHRQVQVEIIMIQMQQLIFPGIQKLQFYFAQKKMVQEAILQY